MLNVRIAEWLLARYAGEQRAGTMMGDLLEDREQKGAWWFWRTYAGILLAVAYRPMLAFVAASLASNWIFKWLVEFALEQIGLESMLKLEFLLPLFLATAGCFVMVYTIIRYGLRSELTQLAGGVAVLASAAILQCRAEWALLGWTSTALVVIIACTLLSRSRKAAMVFVLTGVALCAGFLAPDLVNTMYIRHSGSIGRPGLSHEDMLLMLHVREGMLVLAFMAATWVCARLHRAWIEREPRMRVSE